MRYGSGGGDLRLVSDKIGELGTFGRNIIQHPGYFIGILEGAFDFVVSWLSRKDPAVIYSRGSFGIKNSRFAGMEGVSYTRNGVVHLATGVPKAVLLHEFSHADMFLTGGGNDWSVFIDEMLTDYNGGVMDYYSTRYMMRRMMSDEQFAAFAGYQVYLSSGNPRYFLDRYLAYAMADDPAMDFFLLILTWGTWYEKDVIN